MINASRFAAPTKPYEPDDPNELSFRFGNGKDEAATELRKMADAIEHGDILLQNVQYGLKVTHDDYCMEALYLEFATKFPE